MRLLIFMILMIKKALLILNLSCCLFISLWPQSGWSNGTALIKQYDTVTISEILNREVPDITIHSLNIIETGWDHLVVEVNGEWIFRFPRAEWSVANLKREKQLLDYLKNPITLSIPHYDYFGNDTAFVGYRKISGSSLNQQTYLSFDLDTRHAIAKTLAVFFTQLHQAVSIEQALKWGYIIYDPPFERIESDLSGTVSVDINKMIQEAVAYVKKHPSKQQDLVLLHKDVNGDNLTLDIGTGQIIGAFDFSDAAIGPYSWEFAGLFSIHIELATLTAEIYANMNHVPNPLVDGAAYYILQRATFILEARKEGNVHNETSSLKELYDFVPIWNDILNGAIENQR
jgi:aminoglycoside 2''-phosphotransferase